MKLLVRLGERHPMITVRVEPDGSVAIGEERRRVADDSLRMSEIGSAQLTEMQLAKIEKAVTHYGLRDFGPMAFSRVGGEVTSEVDGDVRTTVFSSNAPKAGPSEGWLFPSGAADEVLSLFDSLSFVVRYCPSSGLPTWVPAPCRELPAGTMRTADSKACMVFFDVPAQPGASGRSTVQETTFFMSGRVRRDRVELGESGWIEQDSVRQPGGDGRVSPEKVSEVHRKLRKTHFFGTGTQTGTAYDGSEIVHLYHRGAVYSKTLCYEVEMGARCGLSPDENEGLDAIRRLSREAGM